MTDCQFFSERSEIIIDWVDFVRVDGEEYSLSNNVVLTDVDAIGEKIAEVSFTLDNNVTDPYYSVKDGDAAYLEVGTGLYEIKGKTEYLAVRDDTMLNGYRLYVAENTKQEEHFHQLDKHLITKINVYQAEKAFKNLHTYENKTEWADLLRILEQGEIVDTSLQISTDEDPVVYQLVFYMDTDSPIAPAYYLYHHGDIWYWAPWEFEVISDEIGKYIE